MLLGVNKVWGLKLFLYKFCRPRFSAFVLSLQCSPQHVYHDMVWWILLLVMQCRWAEMGSDITHKGQGFAPFYYFDFCLFPNAISCNNRITPIEGMNSWKIPSYVFDPGSGFSNVSACLLSNWWNHVHRGSKFTCVIAIYEQDKYVHTISYHCDM